MVKLNELALENITGGKESKIPQSVKDFAKGIKIAYSVPYIFAHDAVVSEEKMIIHGNNRSYSAGAITTIASAPIITIGIYEGVKFIRRKIKGKK